MSYFTCGTSGELDPPPSLAPPQVELDPSLAPPQVELDPSLAPPQVELDPSLAAPQTGCHADLEPRAVPIRRRLSDDGCSVPGRAPCLRETAVAAPSPSPSPGNVTAAGADVTVSPPAANSVLCRAVRGSRCPVMSRSPSYQHATRAARSPSSRRRCVGRSDGSASARLDEASRTGRCS